MSFGYSILGFGAHPSRGTPLAANIDETHSNVDLVDVIGQQTGGVVTFTNQGGHDMQVVATGGSGVYTYSWAVSKTLENSDTGSRFSINTTGTTNTARYNTLTLDGARPRLAIEPPFDCLFTAVCTVGDGSSTVNVNIPLTITGISAP